MFIFLSVFHFCQSTKKIKKLKNVGDVASINGLKIGIKEFAEQFNDYINNLNKDNKKINIITALGYLAAAFASLFSYFIS